MAKPNWVPNGRAELVDHPQTRRPQETGGLARRAYYRRLAIAPYKRKYGPARPRRKR